MNELMNGWMDRWRPPVVLFRLLRGVGRLNERMPLFKCHTEIAVNEPRNGANTTTNWGGVGWRFLSARVSLEDK